MFRVEMTLIPAASSSSTSCQRFSFREPGTFVGQLVDERNLQAPREHRVDVHLVELGPPVLDAAPRYDFGSGDLLGRLPPADVSTNETTSPYSARRRPSLT